MRGAEIIGTLVVAIAIAIGIYRILMVFMRGLSARADKEKAEIKDEEQKNA